MSKSCKEFFPKGFFSKKGKPTHNALMMFFVYLKHTPKDWNNKSIYQPGLLMVRKFFGVDGGCECMLTWGILYGCRKSKTSNERHHAMSLAYHDAKGMTGQGYVYTELKP